MKYSFLVAGLGYIFFFIRYAFQAFIYRSIDESSISEYSLFMAMLMFLPFILGLEKHILRSKSIAQGGSDKILFELDNLVFGALMFIVVGFQLDRIMLLVNILPIVVLELLVLEISRVLIAKGKAIKATVIGGIRAIFPLLSFGLNPHIDMLFLTLWLVFLTFLLLTILLTGTIELKQFKINLKFTSSINWIYFISGSVKAAFPWFTRGLLVFFLGDVNMANTVIAMSIFAIIEMLVQNFWFTGRYKVIMAEKLSDWMRFLMISGTIVLYLLMFFMFKNLLEMVNILFKKDIDENTILLAALLSFISIISSVFSLLQIKLGSHLAVIIINTSIYVLSFAIIYDLKLGLILLALFLVINYAKTYNNNVAQ